MDRIVKLEKRITKLEKRITKLEKSKVGSQHKRGFTSSGAASVISSNIGKFGVQKVVILALYYKSKQTKDEIMDNVKKWGATKKMLNWFTGGNFKQRLIDEGIVFEDGQNKDGKILYSLTKGKGYTKSKEIIQKFEKQI